MNTEEAKNLKWGDRIQWIDGVKGTVRIRTETVVEIYWDDGKRTDLTYDDMEYAVQVPNEEKVSKSNKRR